MSIKIYNTMSKQKEVLTPLEDNHVRMYVCGMTTYDYCHIGHARVLICFDLVARYLRTRGYKVTYIRNITDIDDKIINRANENGEPYHVLAQRFIDAMHKDEAALGMLPPTKEPRATEHIDDIIRMIQTLMDKGYAYKADNGDVYFSVQTFNDYGRLSRKKLDDLLDGVRVDVLQDKQDPRDFALWKAAKKDEVHWDTPWGAGRPGWHIECSAMSTCCLGNHFDIHGGGPDLVFPHHENEIAQSEAATGEKYVNTWMHAGAVRVGEDKMSKSLGNFFTIRDVLEKYHPEVVRFFLISSHYRSAISYSEDSLQEARSGLERMYTALRDADDVSPASVDDMASSEAYQGFVTAMDDDFNTREALSVMFELVKQINNANNATEKNALIARLKGMGSILGILSQPAEAFLQSGGQVHADSLAEADIQALVDERDAAKANRDYARADAIREQLSEQGIVLEDGAGSTRWRRA